MRCRKRILKAFLALVLSITIIAQTGIVSFAITAEDESEYFSQANNTGYSWTELMSKLDEAGWSVSDRWDYFQGLGGFRKGLNYSEVMAELLREIQITGTREDGVSIYVGLISGYNKNTDAATLMRAVEDSMLAGAGTPVGCIKFNGTIGAIPETFPRSVLNQIQALDGQSSEQFFNVMNTVAPNLAVEYAQVYADWWAGKSDTLPYIYYVPCFGTADGSGWHDMITMGLAHRTVVNSPEEVSQVADEIKTIMGTDMGAALLEGEGIAAGLSAVQLVPQMSPYTGRYKISGAAVPLEGGTITIDEPGTFFVNAIPKKSTTIWGVNDPVTGVYNLRMNLSQKEVAASSDGFIYIEVTSNFATGNIGKAPNADLTAATVTPELINKSRWEAGGSVETTLTPTLCTIKLPATHVNSWNDFGGIAYKVQVTGGSNNPEREQARPADFTVTVNGVPLMPASQGDAGWSYSGTTGNNYTSWFGNNPDPVFDTGYDYHTVQIPHGESLVVANTADDSQASWDASIGIPSTENVSLRTGAEAGMADSYGWMCVRPYSADVTYVQADTSAQGEDETGVANPEQAVTRTVTLKGQVTNCWGSNNPVCKLSDAGKLIKSNSVTKTDGSVYDQDPANCSGHSCGSGSVGGGTYNNPWHKASLYECGNHYNGKPGWPMYDEQHPGNCGGSNENIQKDSFGNEISRSCACKSCSSGSVSPNSHDCSFSVSVHDSIGEEYIGQKGMPESGTASGVNQSHEYGLLTLSNSPQSGIDIHWKISWKPSQDKQYYIVTYDVWNVDRASGASGCHGTSRGSSGNKAWGPSGTHYTGTWPSDSVLCQDYTHGTGYSKTCYENMVHQGTHNYTITYKETIDAYAYKTIENASVFSLQDITFKDTHKITRSEFTDVKGTEWEAGTFSAPISDVAIGRSVSAPESVGYLWRCVGNGDRHGEYESGNGRILFEAWVNSLYNGEWGNVSVERPEDYFLGDVTVTIKAVQDSAWGNGLSDVNTWEPISSEPGITTGGVDYDHIHDYSYRSLNDYQPNCADSKFLDITTGDCTSESGVKTALDNSTGNHANVVRNELTAILNAWSGLNSGLKGGGEQIWYKANVISDTLVYGGTSLTNSLIEDSYAVDGEGEGPGFGVPLFNIHAEPSEASTSAGINESLGEKEAYRSHKDAYGNGSKVALKVLLKGNTFSTATVEDGCNMALFGGVSENGEGGTKGLAETTAGQMMSSFGSFGVGCSATKGDPVSSTVYSRELAIDATHTSKTSGVTTLLVETDGSVAGSSFQGYWKTFMYPTVGTGIVMSSVNGEPTGSGAATDFGLACLEEYGTLAISNLPLIDWTPNGSVYTGEVISKYTLNQMAINMPPPESHGDPEYVPRVEIQELHNKIASGDVAAPCGANGSNYLNAIKIYNPISVENNWVIGAQYGKFEDSDKVTDDTEHDQRLTETGGYLNEKSDYASTTKPYVVQSQHLWSWLSPFGNFDSFDDGVGGHGDNTADRSLDGVGTIDSSGNYKGYVDNMNINRWIMTETIAYPFIAGLNNSVHTTKNNVEICIDRITTAHSPIEYGAKPGPATNSILDNSKFFFGNAFGVTNTCNVVESDMDNPSTPVSYVYYRAYGINPFLLESDSEMSGTAIGGYSEYEYNNSKSTRLANKVWKKDKVNLVGSIGNVSIHDTEDFRFSNYFKESTGDWLIDGVIHEVDYNKPLRIVSSVKDICFNTVESYVQNGKFYNLDGVEITTTVRKGHDTLNSTMFISDGSYGGMAGYFDPLPLVPSYNTVDEYRTEAVRLGYKAFISVDTIGQYQSYIYKTDKVPEGPGDEDTRRSYITVKSEYYLYDFDDGKFYDVDIWSGSTGGKERIYNGTDKQTEETIHAGAIYQNPYQDRLRRNIGNEETAWTGLIDLMTENTVNSIYDEYTFIYGNNHYIGRPGMLRLDTRDLSYIGSSNNDSEGRYWGESMVTSVERSNTAQRYHFKDGLTSTTVLTEPLGDNPTQAEIEMANQRVKEEHPHAVLIQFMDFIAKGEVWTIRCNGSQVNQPTFTVYDTNGDDPADPDDDYKYLPKDWDPAQTALHNVISYQGVKTYNPVTGDESGTIDKDLTPMVVYEAYHTSADDRTVSGTH